ncbi:MAG: tetratricopeptide repeat protein [Gammaproteobacteria bacterium]|nr:tetratricopeptide repeat protein [Gammaproteobacteria bacterium]
MSLFQELKRRNVFRVGAAYLVTAWVVVQIGEAVFPAFGVPDALFRGMVILLVLGFPVALIFAWAFEKTPEGIKLEKNVDRSQSMTPVTGKKLDKGIIVVLAIAVVFLLYREATAPDRESVGESPQIASDVSSSTVTMPTSVMPPASEKSIAVLPFSNLSEDESNAFFASGVQEDILTYLSRVADLKVISRTSVLQYAGFKGDVRQVARELGVNHILEGSVRRSGNRVRVTAQLIDARDDEHVWAENYDRDLTDVFAIQTEVAQEIVKALKARLSPEEAKMISARPTNNVEAYDAYLQARDLIRRPEYGSENFRKALPFAQRAVQLDPEFALAYVQLANLYGQMYWLVAQDQTFIDKARSAMDNAQRLAPDMPQVQFGWGEFYYRMYSDYARALKEFESAQTLLPNDSDLLWKLGTTQRRLGRWDESVASYQRAIRMDPDNNQVVNVLAETLGFIGRWQEAVTVLEQAASRNPGYDVYRILEAQIRLDYGGDLDFAREVLASAQQVPDQSYIYLTTGYTWRSRNYPAAIEAWTDPTNPFLADANFEAAGQNALGKIYREMGDHARAEQYFQRAIERARERFNQGGVDWYDYHVQQSIAYAYLGDSSTAMSEIDRATAMRPESADALYGVQVSIARAEVLMIVGRTDEALAEIKRLLTVPVGLTVWILRQDPTWDPLREDPRFKAMVAEVPGK